MSTVPCISPSENKRRLEFLNGEIKSLKLKSEQKHKQDYLAAKIRFVVLIMLALIRFSPFGAYISHECAGTLMIVSLTLTKPIINFFKPIK